MGAGSPAAGGGDRVLPSALLAVVGTALLAQGCFGNDETGFPPGLEPLEEPSVAPPAPRPGDPYPEEVALDVGETRRYDWAQARAYIHAPVESVFAALQVPEVVVDRRAVDRWSATLDTEPEYEHSFRIHNEVDDIITVQFDVSWRMGIAQGSNDRPEVVVATFQKTYGTTFISLLRGSVVARRVNDEVTLLELVEHIDAATGGSDPIALFLRDLFTSVAAHAHGEPLATY